MKYATAKNKLTRAFTHNGQLRGAAVARYIARFEFTLADAIILAANSRGRVAREGRRRCDAERACRRGAARAEVGVR